MADGKAPQVAVIGAGPAGQTAAVALAANGIETVLVAKASARPDNRTTALLAGSVAALKALGVWGRCAPHAAALRTMRIVDDTGRLVRAPEVRFAADEIGLDAFGYNIENRLLSAALEEHGRTLPALRTVDSEAVSVESHEHDVTVRLANGETLTVQLVAGADGRRSLCRAAAGIEVDEHPYPQHALALSFAHSRPHHDASTEFHTASGPFTLVPLPGQRSSLVWVMAPHEAERVAALDDAELSAEIETHSRSILGKIAVEGARGIFPLSVATARRFADRRIALVGEAAHVIPPIGAQGLNLGLRDAATIGELVVEAHRLGEDIGAAPLLDRYDAARRGDVGSRSLAIDLLNRSLLSDFLPVQGARGLGMYLLDRVGPLRRAVMREGVTPSASAPRLMRGEAI